MSEKAQGAAVKYDQGKIRYDLIPVGPLENIAKVYTMGAQKYGDRNWERGLSTDRLYAAMMRHAQEWRKGITCDPESGLPHMAHVAWNAIGIDYFDSLPKEDNVISLDNTNVAINQDALRRILLEQSVARQPFSYRQKLYRFTVTTLSIVGLGALFYGIVYAGLMLLWRYLAN